jgi:hypothetical protein
MRSAATAARPKPWTLIPGTIAAAPNTASVVTNHKLNSCPSRNRDVRGLHFAALPYGAAGAAGGREPPF